LIEDTESLLELGIAGGKPALLEDAILSSCRLLMEATESLLELGVAGGILAAFDDDVPRRTELDPA
jgi:hypothetical protein